MCDIRAINERVPYITQGSNVPRFALGELIPSYASFRPQVDWDKTGGASEPKI